MQRPGRPAPGSARPVASRLAAAGLPLLTGMSVHLTDQYFALLAEHAATNRQTAIQASSR